MSDLCSINRTTGCSVSLHVHVWFSCFYMSNLENHFLVTADSPSTLCLIIFIPKLLRFLLFLKRFRQIRSVTERWSSPTLNVDVFFSQTMVLVRSFHDTRGWSHTLANIPNNKTHKLLLNTPVMVQVAALRLFCRGGKHMINSIHISTSPHIKLCPSSKFFYDVVKTDPPPPPRAN